MKAAGSSLKILLICGIVAPLVFIATDMIAGMLYPDYSFTSQAISELFAIGAPTSGFVVLFFTVFDLLLIAFAIGVWKSANRNRALRVVALMMIGNAVNGMVLWNFFPMNMRGAEAAFTDTMHVVFAGTGVIFIFLALVFGAMAYRNWFRYYTAGTILLLFISGVAFMYTPEVGANLPTPWLGLSERIFTYIVELWLAVLAVVIFYGGRNK